MSDTKRRQDAATVGIADSKSDSFKYDVAISFLARDESTAGEVADRLGQGLSVFFFPRRQEDLAGTDGLESMRAPFFTESRINVVLFREPWGHTPWTRVEETAIKDRCFKSGWDGLFFVVLDRSSKLPVWLPSTHVRFNFEEYGVEQAVGAIKARAQDHGGKIRSFTPLDKAALAKKEGEYLAARDGFLRSTEGANTARESAGSIFVEVEQLCARISSEVGLAIKASHGPNVLGATNGRVTLFINWQQHYINDITNAALRLLQLNGRGLLPGERGFLFHEPEIVQETRFTPDLSPSREFRWVEEGKQERMLTAHDVAERSVNLLIDLIQRQKRGEFPEII